MTLPSSAPNVLGNAALDRFDALIIGSGAGGSAAAHILTTAGWKVLVLEAGDNNFPGLDDPRPGMPVPRFGSDELKQAVRVFEGQDPVVEPRTFRADKDVDAVANPDVNRMSRTVGGTAVHADMKYPRFNEVDFRLASALREAGRSYEGTSFADWPLTYDDLEPFYGEAEVITGVAGAAGADPFASRRGAAYPMPPSAPMYVGLVLAEGARRAGFTPFSYPAAINSMPYPEAPALRRPACVSCGLCSGYGCPNNSKCSPAVTTLRAALLTGNCQLRFNSFVIRLLSDPTTHRVTGALYVDDDGQTVSASADHYILAANAIESARLALLSDLPLGDGPAFHLGAHMLFHRQTTGVGIFRQRLHGERGQAVTHGISDFRGVGEGGTALHPDGRPLGGIVEFGTSSEPIISGKSARESLVLARVANSSITLKRLLVESPFHAHLAVLIMQAEDAPQVSNRVDLDPRVRDVFGLPVSRLTYRSHPFELDASEYYRPLLVDILRRSGAQFGFIDPTSGGPPRTRHVMGGLRMGLDPSESVCDPQGKFHDLENLFCMDGGVFVTGSGYNPTLTIIALALRSAAHLAQPRNPQSLLTVGR